MKDAEFFEKKFRFAKVNKRLGVIFGWAIISKIDGEAYVDTQKHHIPEDSMLEKALDYMMRSRKGGEMHRKKKAADGSKEVEKRGTVPFCFPLTDEIAKAYKIQCRVSGLMIGWLPHEDCREEIVEKFESGEYNGFSVGGKLFSALPFDPEEAAA